MRQGFVSSELYSHNGKLLEIHLLEVAKVASSLLEEKPVELQDKIRDICLLCALLHDIGKATSFFQNYLLDTSKVDNERKQHSILSAFFGFFIALQYFNKTNLFDSFLVFFLISKHHGDLIDPKHSLNFENEYFALIYEQIDSIDPKKFSILLCNLASEFPSFFPIDDFSAVLGKFKRFIERFEKNAISIRLQIKEQIERLHSLEKYLIVNTAFSILLDADKSDVVLDDKTILKSRIQIPECLVSSYIHSEAFYKKSISSPLNHLRQSAYEEVLNKIINLNQRIYTLTLPTGLGKTLISLSFALKLRTLLGGNHRIIYSLPFLSIIDQNFEVFKDVLGHNGIPTTSDILLKHHHLSELKYTKSSNNDDLDWDAEKSCKQENHPKSKSSNNDDFDWDASKILIEGWNSEIIVTTFVQFFHTLVSNKNKSLRKFHRFANSIIILDEVQSIPIKYWQLIRNLMIELVNTFNSYLVFVTATQPLIFDQKECYELSNPEKYNSKLNRIEIIPFVQTPVTIEEMVEKFQFGKNSILFVLNTIASARETFNLIIQKWSNTTFLSTHVVPFERMQRINEIKKKLKAKEPIVVVSTQLIEAGVDIDFDIVVRDLAPFDSIVQSAGRCNRNGCSKGQVFVFYLKKEDEDRQSFYSTKIYDAVLLDITRSILLSREQITESEIHQLSQQYFQETLNRKNQQESKLIIDCIRFLQYSSPDEGAFTIEKFKLLDEKYFEIDVFIELDENAQKLWEMFVELYRDNSIDRFERKRKFAEFKTDFYNYVISIPKNASNRPVDFLVELGLGHVPLPELDYYYDIHTGFKVKPDIFTEVI